MPSIDSLHVRLLKPFWVVISQIWASITRNILSPFNWAFINDDKGMPAPSYKVVFDYLRYWGMWFNWTMRNGFLFDELNGVTQQFREVDVAIFATMLYGDVVPRGDKGMSLVLQHLRGFPLHYHYS